jgi:asparagine synthase (glutamine-hydrolysing)
MKKTMERYLPHDILYRPKMGFVTPISQWLKGPLAQTALGIGASPALAQLDWFDGGALTKAAQDHIAGRSDNGRLLWQMIMLEKSLSRLFG